METPRPGRAVIMTRHANKWERGRDRERVRLPTSQAGQIIRWTTRTVGGGAYLVVMVGRGGGLMHSVE